MLQIDEHKTTLGRDGEPSRQFAHAKLTFFTTASERTMRMLR
jgi:hypothetical protein